MHSIWSCDSSIYILWGCFPGTGTIVTCTWHGQVIMKNMGNISQYEIITKHNITRCKLYTCCEYQPYMVFHGNRHVTIIIPPASTKMKGGYTGFTLSICVSVRLSVCGQNGVSAVSSTILVGSISYFHILSSNFRRCVACFVFNKINLF